jgi:hypothetical protein
MPLTWPARSTCEEVALNVVASALAGGYPMAKLENSKRRLAQAVYAQVKLRDQEGRPFKPQRPLTKWGLVAAARPSREEVAEIRQRLERDRSRPGVADPQAVEGALIALNSIEPVMFQRGGPDFARIAPLMGGIEPVTLGGLADRLIQFREERVQKAADIHKRILDAYNRPQPPEPSTKDVGQFPRPAQGTFRRKALAAAPERVKSVVRVAPQSLSLQALADWAIEAGWDGDEAKTMVALARASSYDPQILKASDYQMALQRQLDHSVKVATAFSKQMDIEPIGFLHLERLTFAPDGIERGELVYSVPLAPGEEVNITHKEWATTEEEFQKIVTDALEEFSEEGVTEKSELAQATGSQQQHAMGFNTGVTASGGYGPVSITSTLGVSIAESASNTEVFSRNQSISVTRKASSRSKKEHKISFKLASAAGTEDQTVRKIRNPFPDKATRADYYQLIRKWEVNVYRYGIRLTYDITIPEPGADVLSKIKEINDLNAALQQGFGSVDSTLFWARFDVKPDDVNRDNYTDLAAQYSAAVPPPPPERKDFDQVWTHDWQSEEEAKQLQFWVLEVDVGDDYVIDGAVAGPPDDGGETHWPEQPHMFGLQSLDDFFGVSGKRQLVFWTKFLGAAYVELRVGAHLREEVFKEWQLKAWAAMRDAAQGRYYEQRSSLKERLAKLTEELGAQDALSLRKFEREEVMKGVLRWLFGPDFEFVPSGLPSDLYAQDETVASQKKWKEVLAHGELIKFLHHAIEWENVLYFLYPYFWSHISRWELKKYLDHPDSMHRVFLKAGSARVVLTIRPGFERDFVSLLETGSFGALPNTHPYMTIIEEMENFAKTNYPGIPPANPEEAALKEEGVLIGTWYEYTPTSALDIAFGETLPSA